MALSKVYIPKHVQTGLINILKKVGRKGDMEDGGAEALLAGAFAGMNVEVGESPLLKDVTAKVLKAFWYYPEMAIGLRETLTEILELTAPDIAQRFRDGENVGKSDG